MEGKNDDPGALVGATGAGDEIAERRLVSNSTDPARTPALRPYQSDVIGRVWAAIKAGTRRIVLVAPTGSGKTVIAGAIVKDAGAQGRRVLILAHRRELITQASRKLHDVGVDAGIILPGFPMRLGEPVQVASIASLHARAIRGSTIDMPLADIVIIDEAHHCRARTYRRILAAYPNAIIIGLTATGCRGDGRGLGNVFEVLIEAGTVAELIAGRHLVPSRIYAPSRPDLTGIRVERGDYVERDLSRRVNTDQLVGDVVEHWLKLADRRPTVVFAVDVAHSVHVRDQFRAAGALAKHIDGSTPTAELIPRGRLLAAGWGRRRGVGRGSGGCTSGKREAILNGLATGTVEVVTNCQVLVEGFDSPDIGCLILARPTKSLGLFRQMIGRALRPAPGKGDAIIIDHSGAVFQHGLPDDPITWSLSEDRRAENKAHAARGTHKGPALVDCPECHAVRFEGAPCPACGWRPRPKPAAIEVADGELAAVDRQRRTSANTYSINERHKFYSQLLWIVSERGYQRGWAGHKFREKFGTWPSWRFADPLPPDEVVRAWVRSRQIAFAKSMEKQRGGGR